MPSRESNFDLLRIFAAIAVIFLHAGLDFENPANGTEILVKNFFDFTFLFAVPIFFMLSGAFILDNDKNSHYREFYRKSFKSVGIHTIIFSIFYAAYTYHVFGTKAMCKGIVIGAPYGHMWYLYTLIGIYLLAPVMLLFKSQVGEKTFHRVSIGFLVVSVLGGFLDPQFTVWDIGYSIHYAAYFMIGYTLRKIALNKKSNGKGVLLILAGLAINASSPYIPFIPQQISVTQHMPLYPIVALASVLVFYGFAHLQIKASFAKPASWTFIFYLVHAVILAELTAFFKAHFPELGVYRMPANVIVTCILSIIVSIGYLKVWRLLDSKYSIADRLCNLIRL